MANKKRLSLDQKIDFDQLSNPYSKITKLILSIYSLETQPRD